MNGCNSKTVCRKVAGGVVNNSHSCFCALLCYLKPSPSHAAQNVAKGPQLEANGSPQLTTICLVTLQNGSGTEKNRTSPRTYNCHMVMGSKFNPPRQLTRIYDGRRCHVILLGDLPRRLPTSKSQTGGSRIRLTTTRLA